MKKFQTVEFTSYANGLNDQIAEIHTSTLSRADKRKALVELGLKDWDLRILYNGIYFNVTAPIRVVTPRGHVFTFGTEMECFVPRADIHRAAEANGVNIAYEAYNHTDGKTWYKFVHDGSVRSTRDYRHRLYSIENDNAIECVSPVLKGTKGLSSLKACCKALNDAGATVNKTCGLHVHVGAQDLTQAQMVNVFKNYQRLEPVIDTFMPESRRNNHYARTLRTMDLDGCSTISEIEAVLGRDDSCSHPRYHKVNPCAYSRHRTIEFRQHGGSTNYAKISAWVNFCIKLVEWSMTNVLTADVTLIDTIPFLNDKEKAFFKKRAAKLASNSENEEMGRN